MNDVIDFQYKEMLNQLCEHDTEVSVAVKIVMTVVSGYICRLERKVKEMQESLHDALEKEVVDE